MTSRRPIPLRRLADIIGMGLPDVYQFAALVVLAHHWNETEGLSWPSPETIAKESGMSPRRATYALRKLEQAGRIIAVGSRKGGRGKSIRYRLNLPSVTGNPAQRAAFSGQKPCTDDTETLHGTTLNPAQRAPEPLRTIYEPGAAAGYAPRGAPPAARNRPPETESPKARRRRQLIGLADLLGVDRDDDEPESRWLDRIEQRNHERLARAANG